MADEDQLFERLRAPEFYYALDRLIEYVSLKGKPTTEKELIKLIVGYSKVYTMPFPIWYDIDTPGITWETFVLECKSRVSKTK